MNATTTKQIQIRDWKPRNKNTLRGFCTVILPSGMIIHDVMLHEKGDRRWVQLPAREYTDAEGVKQFARFIEFENEATAGRFREQVIAALDRHFHAEVSHEQRENRPA
jgi:DNA-binding cell septation regulator SpoVG